jgi:hypothetical protein
MRSTARSAAIFSVAWDMSGKRYDAVIHGDTNIRSVDARCEIELVDDCLSKGLICDGNLPFARVIGEEQNIHLTRQLIDLAQTKVGKAGCAGSNLGLKWVACCVSPVDDPPPHAYCNC